MDAGRDRELREILQRAEQCERCGDAAGEIGELARALALRDDLHPVHARLGVVLQDQGDLARAVVHLEVATRLKPGDARAWSNFAAALNALHRPGEAEHAARKALGLDPGHAWAPFHLGRALESLGRRGEAREAFEQAVRSSPENALAWEALGDTWLDEGRLLRAREALLKSTQAGPDRASAWSRLAASYLHAGELPLALGAMARAEALAPADAAQLGSSRLLTLHYDGAISRGEIFREHVAWARRYAAAPEPVVFGEGADGDRRLRIGYVSPRFHGSALAGLIEPVLCAHDPAAVEIFCYSTFAREDDVSRRMRARAGGWVDASALDDRALAQRMRDDAIDVAVDLAGHTPGHSLLAFMHRPAPVTATWLDYFDTTGLEAIDYFITDPWHSPPDDAQEFTEERFRLPRVRFAYAPPPDAPEVREPPLARGGEGPVLASFSRSAKISNATLDTWRAVLERTPGARMLVKNSSLGHDDERADLARRFRAHGIDPARIEFRGFSAHRDMLEEYNEVDIVLDTFPYNGGITTLEALWMGKPVVTLRGDTLISRQTAAILQAAGLDEWIASDAEGFARIVANLAADPAKLATIGRGMRERLRSSPLLDARGLAAALEAAYRAMWRRYVEKSAPRAPKP
jgi:protein O-GlcNAc transferase